MTETRSTVERLRRRAELVVEPGGYGQFMEIPGHELLALLAVVEAAQPIARLPHPVSSDERDQWREYQQVLVEALADLHSQASDEAGHD